MVARDVFHRVLTESFRNLGNLNQVVLLAFDVLSEDYEMMTYDMLDLVCNTGICDEKAAKKAVQELEDRSLIIRCLSLAGSTSLEVAALVTSSRLTPGPTARFAADADKTS